MCNDIGCPDGYEPILSAWEVECTGGSCTVDQCCDAMCASFPCPDNFIPIEDAADVFCNDGVCTTEQCCDHHADGHGGKSRALIGWHLQIRFKRRFASMMRALRDAPRREQVWYALLGLSPHTAWRLDDEMNADYEGARMHGTRVHLFNPDSENYQGSDKHPHTPPDHLKLPRNSPPSNPHPLLPLSYIHRLTQSR